MAFLGFGLQMAFLRHHSWSAVGYSMYAIITTLQYYLLWSKFWADVQTTDFNQPLVLDNSTLIKCLFAAIAVLISYGTFIGRVGLLELMVVIIVHVVGYSANEMLCLNYLYCFDGGRGMIVHVYSAFFGLGVSALLPKVGVEDSNRDQPSYYNSIVSAVGAMFLFIFFPLFNTMFSVITSRNLSFYNTLFSLVGSTAGGFVFSGMFRERFNFQDIMNCVVSGGVIVATSADILQNPGGAIACGVITSVVTVVGLIGISKVFRFIGLFDTRGVMFSHGIPGVLGGALSSFLILIYGHNSNGNYFNISLTMVGRSPDTQAGYQMACTALSLGLGLMGGLITGAMVKTIANYRKDELFNDFTFWDFDGERINLNQSEEVEMRELRNRDNSNLDSIRTPIKN